MEDWKNFIFVIIFIFVLLILVYWILQAECKDLYGPIENEKLSEEYRKKQLIKHGGNGYLHYKGRGHKDDSIEDLLNRIWWLSTIENRTSKWRRILLASIIASGIILVLLVPQIPSPSQIFITILCIFLIFIGILSYYYFHCDRFPPYYIQENLNYLRKKLNYSEYPKEVDIDSKTPLPHFDSILPEDNELMF